MPLKSLIPPIQISLSILWLKFLCTDFAMASLSPSIQRLQPNLWLKYLSPSMHRFYSETRNPFIQISKAIREWNFYSLQYTYFELSSSNPSVQTLQSVSWLCAFLFSSIVRSCTEILKPFYTKVPINFDVDFFPFNTQILH